MIRDKAFIPEVPKTFVIFLEILSKRNVTKETATTELKIMRWSDNFKYAWL